MRMRLGLLIGFGAGYVLGAKAGHERYEEMGDSLKAINRELKRAGESPGGAVSKALPCPPRAA